MYQRGKITGGGDRKRKGSSRDGLLSCCCSAQTGSNAHVEMSCFAVTPRLGCLSTCGSIIIVTVVYPVTVMDNEVSQEKKGVGEEEEEIKGNMWFLVIGLVAVKLSAVVWQRQLQSGKPTSRSVPFLPTHSELLTSRPEGS